MTDEPNPQSSDAQAPEDAPAVNGHKSTPPGQVKPTGQVRSGLAHRRNPLLIGLEAFAQGVARLILRDPLSTFLALASIGLIITFGVLLGSIGPSSYGRQIPLSSVEALAQKKNIVLATLLDHDSRVELTTREPIQQLWASYPSSGSQNQALLAGLAKSGTVVIVDQQSGKALREIVVQFLIPILLLVCLFALFTRIGADGGAGGLSLIHI